MGLAVHSLSCPPEDRALGSWVTVKLRFSSLGHISLTLLALQNWAMTLSSQAIPVDRGLPLRKQGWDSDHVNKTPIWNALGGAEAP